MTTIKLYDGFDEEWGFFYGIGCPPLDAGTVVRQIEQAAGEELTVRINSGGGYVFDGWAIYNALLNHDKKVTVIVEGIAASIASIIAMAGDEVIMMKGSIMMVHKPSTYPWGDMDADDLRKEAETLDKIQTVLEDIYEVRTGLDRDLITVMVDEETWLTPDEAVTLGFADGISTGKAVAIAKNAVEPLLNKAPAAVRAYANNLSFIQISKKMSKNAKTPPKGAATAIAENETVLKKVKAFFDNLFAPKNASSELADGTVIYYDGDLTVGTSVYSDEEMTTALADGSYELSDGRSITVTAGSVTEIAEASEEEVTDETENSLLDQLNAVTAERDQLRAQLEKATNTLKELEKVKSNHKPAARTPNFSKESGKQDEAPLKDRMAARRAKYSKRGK